MRSIADLDLMSPGSAACRCGQLRLHRIHRLDDVGARLADRMTSTERLAVGMAGVAQILDRIDHVADIRQPHRRAVAVGDHQRLVILGVRGLVVGVDLEMRGRLPRSRPSGGWRWPRPAPRARPPGRCRI